jgi:hypothetical protein
MTIWVCPLMILRNNIISWSNSLIIPWMVIISYYSTISQFVSKDKNMGITKPSWICMNLYHPIKSSSIIRCCVPKLIAMNFGCTTPISPYLSNIIIIFGYFGIIWRNTLNNWTIFRIQESLKGSNCKNRRKLRRCKFKYLRP